MKKNILFAIFAISIISFTSCNKDKSIALEENTISSSPTAVLTSTSYNTMVDVFMSTDIGLIQTSIAEDDSISAIGELTSLAYKIQYFLTNNYDSSFSPNVSDDYKGIIVLGMAYLEYETGDTINNQNNMQIQSVDCIIAAVSGLLGINDISILVRDFKNGVSASTLLGTAKVMLRRVATAITIAIAIYELGDCLDWW